MPRIAYIDHAFKPGSLETITRAEQICTAYRRQGYDLTLRQLYYQFVSRGWIPNSDREYKRLGVTMNNARLSGLLDWDYITDRTRNLRALPHWDEPSSIVHAMAGQYRTDRWASQPTYVEVWVEKDALVGVVSSVCDPLDVAYFSCRGYTSQSELWGAAQRVIRHNRAGQNVVIIHLGDHDPSGIDMTRDIEDRLVLFEAKAAVRRIALNRDQIDRYNPPPNPAKITDARAKGYIRVHGASSWELDALDPTTLGALITTTVAEYRDETQWEHDTQAMETERALLTEISTRLDEVRTLLGH